MSRVRLCWGAAFASIAMVVGGCGSSPPVSVSLSPAAPSADQGIAVKITATVANDRSQKGVTWSLSGEGTLSSTTGLTVTYISPVSSPTATVNNAQKVTVTATSAADPAKKASVSITVNPLPAIPIAQKLANGTVGAPYSEPISLIGGTAPVQWSVYNGPIETGFEVGGSVPDGLALDASTGTISGTPTAAGTWYFEATATDADGEIATDGFLSLEIRPKASAEANPAPFLNQTLVPTAVAPGGGGLTLAVTGTGFVDGATVNFDGVGLATTFVNSEHLSAAIPAKDVATAKTASVTVVNPAPGGGASNVDYFQVGAPETAVNFAKAPDLPLPVNEVFGLAVADFDGDGKPDVAVAAGAAGLAVVLGNGDGTFKAAPNPLERVPSPPFNDFGSPYIGPMTVGDFNHSGHVGLAVSQFNNEVAVILLGNGDGTFTTSSAAFADTEGQTTTAVAAADFNADGGLDLAFANQTLGVSPVALGYGGGAFNTAGSLFTQGFPAGVAVGDFNRDGRLDAAVAGGGSTKYPFSGVAVSLGNGKGKFKQASGSPMPLGKNLSAIVAADFNGDGKLDLAMTDASGNAVLVLLGNGDGSFQAPISMATGKQPQAMVAGDFNNDGKMDLAVANFPDNTVTLLLGQGDGTFTEASGSPYAVGNGPLMIAAADFNGDGKLDLAVGNAGDGTVSILLQK